MPFKAEATSTTSNYTPTKKYLWREDNGANGIGTWVYVTTDAPGVVEQAGYFTDAAFKATCHAGDQIRVYQVGSIDDSRPISEDLRTDMVDYNVHFVIGDTGPSATINITPASLVGSVEYSLP